MRTNGRTAAAASDGQGTFMATFDSPELGPITLASDGESLTGLWLAGQKYFAASAEGPLREDATLPIFAQTMAWLGRYFQGSRPDPRELALAPQGSAFRQRVWEKLLEIPYGKVRTYGDIAADIAREDGKARMSAQAVGGAVGHNPISIVIPCHRVVGASGSLTGYAGGIGRKAMLLEHEGALAGDLFVPKRGTAL